MSLAPGDVTAVVVTRGDVPLDEIEESLLLFDHVVVWDNSQAPDFSVYGRYAVMKGGPCREVVFVQDDDCVLPPLSIEALLAAYEPGVVVANMPERFRAHYSDSCLVGFGAIFDRHLPDAAFERFDVATACDAKSALEDDFWFRRTCDVVFTTLTPFKLLDLPYRDLSWAHAENRMWKQQGHVAERMRMLDLARRVRDGG